MENEMTARCKTRSSAGFDKEPPLEAVSAGAAETIDRPAGYVAPKTISGRRFLSQEFHDTLSNYDTKEMVLRTLRDTSAENLINILDDLKRGILVKNYEIAATNFANALYPLSSIG